MGKEKSSAKTWAIGAIGGVVAGATVVFAAAADLAARPRPRQELFLWLLFASGLLLAIVTVLAIERVQASNERMKRKLGALERAAEDGQRMVRERYAVARASRRMKRTLGPVLASLRHQFPPSDGLPCRFGIWSSDLGTWVVPPVEEDDLSRILSNSVWDKPLRNSLPNATSSGDFDVAEVSVELRSTNMQSNYFSIQMAARARGAGGRPSATASLRSGLQQIVKAVVDSDSLAEEVAEVATAGSTAARLTE